MSAHLEGCPRRSLKDVINSNNHPHSSNGGPYELKDCRIDIRGYNGANTRIYSVPVRNMMRIRITPGGIFRHIWLCTLLMKYRFHGEFSSCSPSHSNTVTVISYICRRFDTKVVSLSYLPLPVLKVYTYATLCYDKTSMLLCMSIAELINMAGGLGYVVDSLWQVDSQRSSSWFGFMVIVVFGSPN